MSYSCITNPDGVLVLDWIYGACEKITGCTAEELLAMKCWGELVFEEDLPLFKEHVLDVKPGTSDMCQIRLKNKNGKNCLDTGFCQMYRPGKDRQQLFVWRYPRYFGAETN